jgi:hypothetical protein
MQTGNQYIKYDPVCYTSYHICTSLLNTCHFQNYADGDDDDDEKMADAEDGDEDDAELDELVQLKLRNYVILILYQVLRRRGYLV